MIKKIIVGSLVISLFGLGIFYFVDYKLKIDTRISELTNTVAVQSETINEKILTIEELQERKLVVEEERDVALSNLALKNAEFDTLSEVRNQLLIDIESVTSQKNNALAEIETLTSSISSLNEDITELESELSAELLTNSQNQELISSLQSDIESVTSQKNNALAEIETLTSSISSLNEDITELQSELSAELLTNSQNQELISSLQSDIESVTSQKNNALAEIETLTSSISSLNEDITELQIELSAELLTNSQNQALILSLQADLSTLQGLNTNLENALLQAQNENSGLDLQIQALNSDITILNGQIVDLNGQISSLNLTVSSLESQILVLESQLENQENSVVSYEVYYDSCSLKIPYYVENNFYSTWQTPIYYESKESVYSNYFKENPNFNNPIFDFEKLEESFNLGIINDNNLFSLNLYNSYVFNVNNDFAFLNDYQTCYSFSTDAVINFVYKFNDELINPAEILNRIPDVLGLYDIYRSFDFQLNESNLVTSITYNVRIYGEDINAVVSIPSNFIKSWESSIGYFITITENSVTTDEFGEGTDIVVIDDKYFTCVMGGNNYSFSFDDEFGKLYVFDDGGNTRVYW